MFKIAFLRSSLMMFRDEAVLLLGTCVCWVVVETRRETEYFDIALEDKM
jgi:hypothetical protein